MIVREIRMHKERQKFHYKLSGQDFCFEMNFSENQYQHSYSYEHFKNLVLSNACYIRPEHVIVYFFRYKENQFYFYPHSQPIEFERTMNKPNVRRFLEACI